MGVKGNALEKRVISPGRGGVLEPRIDSGDLLPLLGEEGMSPSDWRQTGEDANDRLSKTQTYEEEVLDVGQEC